MPEIEAVAPTLQKKKVSATKAAEMFRGSEKEVWIKLLKMRHRNRSMTEDGWHAAIEAMKKESVG